MKKEATNNEELGQGQVCVSIIYASFDCLFKIMLNLRRAGGTIKLIAF